MSEKPLAPASLAAQAMGWIDPVTKAVVPPIHMASTYVRDEDNGYRSGRIYARADNPTFDQAEATLAALEGGAKALVFSSGMSAATACFLALSPGDHVVAPKVMYWSLRNWLLTFATQWGLTVEFVDGDRTDAFAAAVRPGRTKLVWLETPANPTWAVSDIAAVAEIAHKAGALLGVDSTVATPVLTRPIEHAAATVMHPAPTYPNGPSSIIAAPLLRAHAHAHSA
ncbi:MAG: aminotransferase class V-fold PLP-dependent enzyme, partial [Reyranella sp.]|nr:aminotransferase class V-fold PLP-dependent enzyme [Reyranella sp.]